MLSISQAIKLAKILDPYFPKELDSDILRFVGKILHEMVEGGNPKDYIRCISIMHGVSEEMVVLHTHESALTLFVNGLLENDAVTLMDFYRKMVRHG